MTTETLLPPQRDSHAQAGRLWKSEHVAQVTIIDGVPTPLHVRRHDVQTDSTTALPMTEVTYDVTLPEEMCDPKQFRTTVAAPVW